jgi:carbonic anhydrase/acetyltransferase-like protein (isoleucine patch superfamily)
MSIRPYQNVLPRLGERVYIDPDAVLIGDVVMGDDSSAWPGAIIRGDVHWIRIGRRTSVQDGSVLHVTHDGPHNPGGFPLQIGDDVTIGHQAMLHGCTLGDRILVGMAAMVLDGAVVEDEVIIAAGTLVPPGKTLESGYVYMGRPASRSRSLTPREREFFRYTSARYVKLAEQYRLDRAASSD